MFGLLRKIQDLKEEIGDKDPRYKDKIEALKAAKDCLNEKIDINQFQSILDNHAAYDTGVSLKSVSLRSDTGILVDNVLKNRAIKIFRENKLAEMQDSSTFKKYSKNDQEQAVQIFNEKMDKIDYEKLDIDSLKGNNGRIDNKKCSEAILDQYPDLKNMEKYTQDLANTIRPAAHLIKELDTYISFVHDQFYNTRKPEK